MSAKAVAGACRRWKTTLQCIDGQARLTVDGYYPRRRSGPLRFPAWWPGGRGAESAGLDADKQRECVRFGSLVMEGRDIGSNVFPETEFKYYLDATLEERSRRRTADGVEENLAARRSAGQPARGRATHGAARRVVVNNSQMTSAQTSTLIIEDIRRRMAGRPAARPDPRRHEPSYLAAWIVFRALFRVYSAAGRSTPRGSLWKGRSSSPPTTPATSTHP